MGGWVNRLGLPNPGIDSVSNIELKGKIVSLHGFFQDDWKELLKALYRAGMHKDVIEMPIAIELNFSCPNVGMVRVDQAVQAAKAACGILGKHCLVIAKLPPIKWMYYAIPLYDVGISCFHLCNTMQTPSGGLSGKVLKQYSLWAVDEVKQFWGKGVTVLGGGGVTDWEDAFDYYSAGADHVVISSMLLNPFNHKKVESIRNNLSILMGA